MKKVLLVFCLLLTTTFLFAETINWQRLKTDKDYKSISNRELVNKIIKNINFYMDDIKEGKISFSNAIKTIMNNNITSIIQDSKMIGKDKVTSNFFVFGYKCNTLEEINKNANKIPLIIVEMENNTIPFTYGLRIYGNNTHIINIKTGEVLDFYKLNKSF